MATDDEIERTAIEITKRLADEGKLIEAGWHAFRVTSVPRLTEPNLLAVLRITYLAGAQHVFGSIMNVFDVGEGDEPTPDDLRRMELIATEMEAIHAELKRAYPHRFGAPGARGKSGKTS